MRVAESVYNTASSSDSGYTVDHVENTREESASNSDTLVDEDASDLSEQERKVVDHIGEALARLGRVKRVGLGLTDKANFVRSWKRRNFK